MTLETGAHYPLRLDSLPRGWRAGYVGEFAKEIQSGFASGEHNQTGAGVPHLRPMNIDRGGKLDFGIVKFVAATKDARRLAEGDVLFNNTNSSELVGKTAVINRRGDFAFSNHMTRILFNDDVLPKFASLQLHFLWMRGYFRYNCVKHVNQASVSSRTLASAVPFIWAPVVEQEHIVAEIDKQFSRLDEAVADLKRVEANLKRHKAAILKSAVEGRLVPTEAEVARREGRDYQTGGQLLEHIRSLRLSTSKASAAAPADNIDELPALPPGWAWARLDDIAELQGGITVDGKRKDASARQVPYLRVANVQRGFLDLSEVKTIMASEVDIANLTLCVGDILFNEGGDRDKLGRGWVWDGQIAVCIHQNHVFRARPILDTLSSKFISWWGNTFGKDYFLREGKQTTNLASISLRKLRRFPVPIPPASEQARIAAKAARLLSIIDGLEPAVGASMARSSSLRAAMLAKAFSGHAEIEDTERKFGPIEGMATMQKRALPQLPPPRASGDEADREDLLVVLERFAEGVAVERLFVDAGYKGDEIDQFYRDLSEVSKLIELTVPKNPKNTWPFVQPALVRLRQKG